jgi:hypothetical protein
MTKRQLFWNAFFVVLILMAWLLVIVSGMARGEAAVPPAHECHLYGLAEAEWAEVVTIIDSAIHGQRTFILIRTADGCSCMLEAKHDIQVPKNGAVVKIYGLRLGIPGFTRLQLMVLEFEERT